jgi:hypothetical protein
MTPNDTQRKCFEGSRETYCERSTICKPCGVRQDESIRETVGPYNRVTFVPASGENAGDDAFLAMEMVEGRPLSEVIPFAAA